MKKRMAVLLLALSLCICLLPARAAGDTTVVLQINNTLMGVERILTAVDDVVETSAPISKNDRTLVPVSCIIRAFGGESGWDPATNDVWFALRGKRVTHTIGTDAIHIDGRTIQMDVPSEAIEGRTYVPVRFILEALGLWVGYEPTYMLVVVSTRDQGGADLLELPDVLAFLDVGPRRSEDPAVIGQRPSVPDLIRYFGLDWEDMEITEHRSGVARYFSAYAEVGLMAGEDHIRFDSFEALPEFIAAAGYPLELVKEDETNWARYGEFTHQWHGDYTKTYYFASTAAGADEAFWCDTDKTCQLKVSYHNWLTSKDTWLTIEWAKGMTVVDTGARSGETCRPKGSWKPKESSWIWPAKPDTSGPRETIPDVIPGAIKETYTIDGYTYEMEVGDVITFFHSRRPTSPYYAYTWYAEEGGDLVILDKGQGTCRVYAKGPGRVKLMANLDYSVELGFGRFKSYHHDYTLYIDISPATGSSKSSLMSWGTCPTCGGSGTLELGGQTGDCPTCGGWGSILR